MNLDDAALILSIIGAVGGIGVATVRLSWNAVRSLDRRFDLLEDQINGLKHAQSLERQSNGDRLELIEYRINANTELIQHKAKRLEGGLRTLSSALQRVSHGAYVPRGPADWPTDDSPTDIPDS